MEVHINGTSWLSEIIVIMKNHKHNKEQKRIRKQIKKERKQKKKANKFIDEDDIDIKQIM